jgi:uncharacterized membrane protein
MTTDSPGALPSAAVRPAGKWRALLIASLALNLLIAGIAGSAMFRHRHGHGMGGRGTEEIGLQGFLKSLPAARAKELRAAVKGEKADMKPLFDATRAARRQAADAIAAEPFDADKLTQAFGTIDAAEANVKAAARTAIVKAAGLMTADERKALAEHWKSRRAKFFRDRGPPAP